MATQFDAPGDLERRDQAGIVTVSWPLRAARSLANAVRMYSQRPVYVYDRDTTKGGHEDLLPIPDELAPWLEASVAASRSQLVFPAEDGTQRDPGTKLQHVFRRALGRAGIVTGYVHKCRRKSCGFEEQLPHPDAGRANDCYRPRLISGSTCL